MSAAAQRMATLKFAGASRPSLAPLSVQRSRTPDPVAMSATDPRWVLAARTAVLLKGGQAGILAPEHRRKINAMASRLGLRAFDAGLVIAIVQDSVRSGRSPLGTVSERSLSLVQPAADQARAGERALGLMIASFCLGAVIFSALLALFGVV